jgi:hypothetical protein
MEQEQMKSVVFFWGLEANCRVSRGEMESFGATGADCHSNPKGVGMYWF